MRHIRLSRVATAAFAGAAAAVLAFAGPAAADPAGNNGTVKIESTDVNLDEGQVDTSNDPHVSCDFQVKFFGFDTAQDATITFTMQAPTGNDEVLLSETKTISPDQAGGGPNDPDAIFDYSGKSFGLDKFTADPQQGFHIKLTILSDGVPGGKKHKVFWLAPCPADPGGGGDNNPPGDDSTPTPPAHNDGGSLPVTGVALTGIITAGVLFVGGGATLLVLHRRRSMQTNA